MKVGDVVRCVQHDWATNTDTAMVTGLLAVVEAVDPAELRESRLFDGRLLVTGEEVSGLYMASWTVVEDDA